MRLSSEKVKYKEERSFVQKMGRVLRADKPKVYIMYVKNTNDELKLAILEHFGEDSYKDGLLDRKYIASIVFNDKEKLDLLNSFIHPATIKDAEEWMLRQKAPYAIKEAALLFESGASENLDYIIGVYAPQHLRVQRVMKRDKLPVEEIMKRISRQIDEEMKMKLCDFVITNNEQELLTPQVIKLHEKFIAQNT